MQVKSPVRVSSVKQDYPDGSSTIAEEWRGLQTDIKPILPPDRHCSSFFEIDTKKVTFYNAITKEWV